jgi:hypothetical protein
MTSEDLFGIFEVVAVMIIAMALLIGVFVLIFARPKRAAETSDAEAVAERNTPAEEAEEEAEAAEKAEDSFWIRGLVLMLMLAALLCHYWGSETLSAIFGFSGAVIALSQWNRNLPPGTKSPF